MHPSVEASQTDGFAAALKGTFHITPWLLVVPVLTGVLIVKKVPAVLTLFCADLPAPGGMGGGESRLACLGIRRTFVLGCLQGDNRDVLRLYRHSDRQCGDRFLDFHARHDGDAQYGVPDYLFGDVRRRIGRKRHVAEPDPTVRAVGSPGGYVSRSYGRDGIYVQRGDGRPVYFHSPHQQPLPEALRAERIRKPSVEPCGRRFGYGHFGAYPVELVRHDASDGPQGPHIRSSRSPH